MKECPQCHRCYADLSASCDDDGQALLASIPGEPLIDGRYELERRLGQGSLGIVFKAKHKFLKTTHAVKIITPALAGDDPSFATRFREDVLAAKTIRHQNIVAVTDFAAIENSISFLVMEFVAGKSFAELLSSGQRIEADRALELLSAVSAGVAAAHKKGLAHGNLKPANIILPEDFPVSDLKVLDLGLAKLRRKDWTSTKDQQQAAFLNSAFYRAPELWSEDTPDERSDVYSLATLFYEMLTGVVPFKADSIGEVRNKVLTQQIPSFDLVGLEVSPALEEAIFGGLSKGRDDRTPTVKEFVSDVRHALLVQTLELRRDEETQENSDYWTVSGRDYSAGIRRTERFEGGQGSSSFDQGNLSTGANVPTPPASNPRIEPVSPANKPATIVDENVQFTVFRPRAVEPEVSYSILVYAHLAERAPDAPADSPEPRELVQEKAEEALGTAFHAYADTVEDSQLAIPRKGVLTFVPDFPGLTLAPPQHMLVWRGPVHELEFTFTAGRELEGQTIRGNVRVYLGAIVLAELNIAINVNTAKARQLAAQPRQPDSMPTYRKIFASYSHRDEAIVQQFEQLVDAFGDKYLRDVRDIRAGEKWNDRLQELIRDADVFQLFWSKNSMKSEFVKDEWNYALSLNKPNFIRPTFWEEPMPEDKQAGLPPAALLELQFKRVPILTVPGAPQTTPGYGSSVSPAAVEPQPPPNPASLPPTPPPLPRMRSMPPPISAPPPPESAASPSMRSMPPPMTSTPPPPPIVVGGVQESALKTSASPPYPSESLPRRARRNVILGQYRPDAFPERGTESYREYTRKETSPVMLWLVVLIAILVLAGGIRLLLWYFLLG